MTTIVNSIGLKGMEGYKVKVEVQAIPGKEGFRIISLFLKQIIMLYNKM